ncbi:MAG: hypothetical protein RL376_283 [Verrucomicrobiota bacterium]|jgi:uncharacterized membrane protein YgdD (TMEM256/DUF423 family)
MNQKIIGGLAFNGFIAVSLGAFGAHALKPVLLRLGTLETWQTGGHYHLAHSVAGLVLVAWAQAQPAYAARLARVAVLWLAGCLLFSGSLYGLALGGPRWLGPVTPLGGVAFLAGWGLLAWDGFRARRA